MAKKILVFLTATLLLIFVGLLVIYFYAHKSINKENSILNFIPAQTDFVIRIEETSKSTNEFFSHPLVRKCFNLKNIQEYWQSIDSVTSRNYKTAEVLQQNTSYICIDSTRFMILVDLNKKTNDHFIDQFLSNSTNHRKIEKFKEGYKAFYPQEGKPMYYFTKHNVFGISKSPEYLISSLANADLEKSDSLITMWDQNTNSKISIWGKSGTESMVLDSFISPDIFFNGWIDRWSSTYSMEIELSENKIEFAGELNLDSAKLRSYYLTASGQNQQVMKYMDSSAITNEVYSVIAKDSLGKENNLVYTYHLYRDSANNLTHLMVSNNPITKYLFTQAVLDTSVQLIHMADEHIPQIAVMNWEIATRILPIIPIQPDTGKLFAAMYADYFLLSNHTLTILQAVPLIHGSKLVKTQFERFSILSGSRSQPANSNIQSDFSIRSRNGVISINCVLLSNTPD